VEEIVPPFVVQVTVLLLVPLTLAVNCCMPPVCTVTLAGATVTPLEGGGGVEVYAPLPQPAIARVRMSRSEHNKVTELMLL
jgi:hypothetical protein